MNRSKLVFKNFAGNVTIPYCDIGPWQIIQEPQLEFIAETDQRLLKKDSNAKKLSGRVLLFQRAILHLRNGTQMKLSTTDTAEFLQFIEEKVKPKIWQSKKIGQARMQISEDPELFDRLTRPVPKNQTLPPKATA